MQVLLREYMGAEERDRQAFTLSPGMGTLTFGRGAKCTHKIGSTLGSLGLGISKVQATITVHGDRITLADGGFEGPSMNGIYSHGCKVDAVPVVPGLDVTLFKHGLAKVSLLVSEDLALVEYGKDTYTGEHLLSAMQSQVTAFDGQLATLHVQVSLLADQLAARKAIDSRQNRVLAVLFAAIAAIVLASGWMGGSAEDKKQWSTTLTSVAIGVAALYFKTKDKPA